MRRSSSTLLAAVVAAALACAGVPVAQRQAGPVAAGVTLDLYAHPKARATVLLVHDTGVNARVWQQGSEGLATSLWRDGFSVVAIDHARIDPTLPELSSIVAQTIAALPQPLFVVGHGLGGTALVDALTGRSVRVAGAVLLGVPLTFGGRTPVFEHVLVEASGGPQLVGDASAALQRQLLTSIGSEPVGPVPGDVERVAALAATPELPLLILTAPVDAWAPPWQGDPAVLGLRRDNIERVYLTRANGLDREYGHIDLVAHHDARDEIDPLITDWLDRQLSARQ